MILNRLSIRTRITVGTLLLAGLFFAGTALLVERAVESILFQAATTLLHSDAAPFVAAITNEPGETLDSPGAGQLVAVVDPTGAIIQSTFPPALAARLGDIAAQTERTQEVVVPGADYLVRAERVQSASGTWTVYSARNEAASELVLEGLSSGLIFGLIGLTLLFGIVSWLLISAALRPVGRLRRSAEALVDSNSSDTLPVGPARDEVQDLAKTLNTLITNLRAATERERQMVSDASHELRTPLAILQAQLELLRTGDRSTLDSDIEAAERAVQRLVRLATTLLELSRIEASPEQGASQADDLERELVDAIDRARFAARSAEIAIEYHLAPSPAQPRAVAISPHGFAGILDNLLMNAITAVGHSGVIVTSLEEADAGAVLIVSDTGPGIPAEFIDRAFDRFSQASDSREGRQGTGLGLSIVAAIVHSAGGTIQLANSPGSGLRATVTIPIVGIPSHGGISR